MSILRQLLDLLLPADCLGCGSPLPAAPAPLSLCARCRGRLVRVPSPGCRLCSRHLPVAPAGAPLCPSCRAHPPAYDELIAVWSYEPPLDRVVVALKFRRLEHLGAHLAEGIARAAAGRRPALDAVVPVPLHWRRRLGRGYNQAEAIARPLARHLCLPLWRCLARRRATPPQTSLDRGDRGRNLRRAFVPRGAARIAGARLLLVDDVITTGATLSAAADCLKRAGAAAVVATAAARTP